MANDKPSLPADRREFLARASEFLENPSLLIRVADQVGKPLEFATRSLPARARSAVQAAVNKALHRSLNLAASTLGPPAGGAGDWADIQSRIQQTGRTHLAAATATGAIGGFFGLAGLSLELPVTTTLMLRSISDIAAAYGVDVSRPENRLECLYVFSLGSKGSQDDSMDSSYLTSRIVFAQTMRKAGEHVALHGVGKAGPALMQFISRIAARYEIAVTEKILLEALPVVGALGGAAINAAFLRFYNDAAKFHFGVKAIEAEFGEELCRAEYRKMLR